MKNQDRDSILQASARALAWDLFAAAGYGRLRVRINVQRFDREIRSAARLWRAINRNLQNRKE